MNLEEEVFPIPSGQVQLYPSPFYVSIPMNSPAAVVPLFFLLQTAIHPDAPPVTSPLCLASPFLAWTLIDFLMLLCNPFRSPRSQLLLIVQAGIWGSHHTVF